MSYSNVLQLDKRDDGVALLTLSRPEQRNALSAALRTDIANCLKQLEEDPHIRSVVLTGAGESFCAGFDLKELGEGDANAIFAEARTYHHTVHTFSKPLIAAVNGPALAGGMDLAFMCDVRLGCPDSRFGQPQVRMGIPAAYDLLRCSIDESTARYLCLTGDIVSADEARARGLLYALHGDRDELAAQALACAIRMAESKGNATMKTRFITTQPVLFE